MIFSVFRTGMAHIILRKGSGKFNLIPSLTKLSRIQQTITLPEMAQLRRFILYDKYYLLFSIIYFF